MNDNERTVEAVNAINELIQRAIDSRAAHATMLQTHQQTLKVIAVRQVGSDMSALEQASGRTFELIQAKQKEFEQLCARIAEAKAAYFRKPFSPKRNDLLTPFTLQRKPTP